MIIIKLQGGLGNQLLQYALGKSIEKKYKKEVKYDVSSFSNQKKVTPRIYLLNKFRVEIKIASDEEINKTRHPFGVFSKISYLIKKALNKFFFKKYHIAYEPDFLESVESKNSAYLEGYWQSFRYAESCVEELRKEIIIGGDTSLLFKKAEEEILKGESVAIHIRRGDYLKTEGGLDVLDISYYKSANDFILESLKNIRYYIFTDDVAWAKENLQFLGKEDVVYISDFGFKDYEELILMSQCKNLVIANSSFSWWGAMLNNKKGVIICPKDWRNIFLKNDENLCPKEWVRI